MTFYTRTWPSLFSETTALCKNYIDSVSTVVNDLTTNFYVRETCHNDMGVPLQLISLTPSLKYREKYTTLDTNLEKNNQGFCENFWAVLMKEIIAPKITEGSHYLRGTKRMTNDDSIYELFTPPLTAPPPPSPLPQNTQINVFHEKNPAILYYWYWYCRWRH